MMSLIEIQESCMDRITAPPSADKKSIEVLIVDDMVQVRQELRQLLQLTEGLVVVGEAGDGRESILQAERLHPDVVIMDLEMPILDGLQATTQIKQRKLAKRVVMLSVHSEPVDVERAMQAGADAFIQKGSPYKTLIESIHPNK
jgi:NarL family two-component system response regulator LiaR